MLETHSLMRPTFLDTSSSLETDRLACVRHSSSLEAHSLMRPIFLDTSSSSSLETSNSKRKDGMGWKRNG
jgi:hypothetical protein